jgi:hypothetical protein
MCKVEVDIEKGITVLFGEVANIASYPLPSRKTTVAIDGKIGEGSLGKLRPERSMLYQQTNESRNSTGQSWCFSLLFIQREMKPLPKEVAIAHLSPFG